jgi:hypothetical protein
VSEYATESPVSLRRRRQRRRTLITIGVILLGLFFAFWYALSYYQSDETSGSPVATSPTCQPGDPDALVPGDVTILVLNATNRSGLAASTAKDLARRGFKISGAENDDSGRDAPKVVELRYGKKGKEQARLVRAQFPKGVVTLHPDGRKGTTVDVVLGSGYKKLRAQPTPTAQTLPTCPASSGS